MAKSVTVLGAAFILIGLAILFLPEQAVSVWDWGSRSGLYLSAAIRVVMGLVLIISAPASRYPKGLRVFGALVLIAGLVLPFLPLDFWAAVIQWGLVEQVRVFRVVGGLGGLLFGGFLIHASRPKPSRV